MAPPPSTQFPQFGCLFCSRSYAAINLLIKHQDRYISEYCKVYHPDGTTQFQAGSHPVPILRYVRREADRHPGVSHDNIVWEPVTFKPWAAPVITAVRLENPEAKRRHRDEFRYLTAEQWIGRLGEIVEAEDTSDAGDKDDEGIEGDEDGEDDEESEESGHDEDPDASDDSDNAIRENRNDNNSDENNSDDDEGMGMADAVPSDPESDAAPSPIRTPTRSGNRIAINRTATNRSTRPDIFSPAAAGDIAMVRLGSSYRLSKTKLTSRGPYFGRNATVNVTPSRSARHGRARRVVEEEETDDDDSDDDKGSENDKENDEGNDKENNDDDDDDDDEALMLPPPSLPATPASLAPPAATSSARASQFHTPGNVMPIFLRLSIVLHPMSPPWIVPVPAPYTLVNTIALIRDRLLVRGVGGDGFPDLVGLSGRAGLINDAEWTRMRLVGGLVEVGLEWDIC